LEVAARILRLATKVSQLPKAFAPLESGAPKRISHITSTHRSGLIFGHYLVCGLVIGGQLSVFSNLKTSGKDG